MLNTLFFGGTDIQRSLNHYDSQCINLYPTTNDDGSIKAFYSAPGLLLYSSIPAAAIASGIYTASNGRCFVVAATTLYEIAAGGALTSRGTVTAGTISRMSDNGIELIIVNGTDGWLFTFATNVLKKITVTSADFTVTVASPAICTKATHGLVAGDGLLLTTTTSTIASDNLLTSIAASPTIDTGVNPYGIVNSPDGSYVYALNTFNSQIANMSNIRGTVQTSWENSIMQYVRNQSTGKLDHLTPSFAPIMVNEVYLDVVAKIGAPSFLSTAIYNSIYISPDGLFVYVLFTLVIPIPSTSIQYCVGFSVSATTGALTYSNLLSHVGAVYNSLTVTSDGLCAFITNTASNTISQFSRSTTTGVLTPLAGADATVAGTSVTKIISTPDSAASTGNVYAISNANVIRQYVLAAGKLTAPTTVATGTLPKDIILSVDNKSAYVTNYTDNTISQYSRAQTTPWALTALTPATIATGTGTGPTSLAIAPDGASLYATNYGSNSVTQLSRDTTTFLLSSTTVAVASTGTNPTGITITPDGKNVYVTNFNSATISEFSRTPAVPVVGLPTGLSTNTIYYVITAGLTANTFELSLTVGGTAVNTTGVQAGIHTYTSIGYGFPNGCTTIAYVDGRFVAIQPNTQNFYVSNVLDGGIWYPLNVQTADSNPDYIIGQVVSHNELIIFCEQSGETYYDSGSFPSPFVRNASGVFEVGCISPYSIAKIDNSVMWLGKSTTGQGVIYRLQGYTPVRISTYSIEYAMQKMSTVADARAFTYQQDGHHFYVISFPTGNKTFVFDVNTQLWHERANFSAGVFSRWEAQEYAFFDGKHLVCDYTEGKIYSIDLNTYAYGTEVRKCVRSFRVPTNSMLRTIHHKMALEAEMGVGSLGGATPTVMLKYSNDGGHTWSADNWRDLGIGSIGEYAKRVFWHRLGMTTGQPRLYELSTTAAVKIVLLNIFLE